MSLNAGAAIFPSLRLSARSPTARAASARRRHDAGAVEDDDTELLPFNSAVAECEPRPYSDYLVEKPEMRLVNMIAMSCDRMSKKPPACCVTIIQIRKCTFSRRKTYGLGYIKAVGIDFMHIRAGFPIVHPQIQYRAVQKETLILQTLSDLHEMTQQFPSVALIGVRGAHAIEFFGLD